VLGRAPMFVLVKPFYLASPPTEEFPIPELQKILRNVFARRRAPDYCLKPGLALAARSMVVARSRRSVPESVTIRQNICHPRKKEPNGQRYP